MLLLSKEIKQIENNDRSVKDILSDLLIEHEEINKKIHLFLSIALVQDLKIILTSQLKSFDIEYFQIKYVYDYEIGNSLKFYLLNKDKISIERIKNKIIDPIKAIKTLLINYNGFEANYINEKLNQTEDFIFNIEDPFIFEKILNLLLSTELRINLECEILNSNLIKNNININQIKKI